MSIKPYVSVGSSIAKSVGEALKRIPVFDLQAYATLSDGFELGIGLTIAGFSLAVALSADNGFGDLSIQAGFETPAFGADVIIGLAWPGTLQRQFEADVRAALTTLATGDAAGDVAEVDPK